MVVGVDNEKYPCCRVDAWHEKVSHRARPSLSCSEMAGGAPLPRSPGSASLFSNIGWWLILLFVLEVPFLYIDGFTEIIITHFSLHSHTIQPSAVTMRTPARLPILAITLLFITSSCSASYLRGGGLSNSEEAFATGSLGGAAGAGGKSGNPDTHSLLQNVYTLSPASTANAAVPKNERDLTGALQNKGDSVHNSYTQRSGYQSPAVGTPPLQTLQGQALGPAELPVLLPFASPYVTTP
jgi:hypothetical protein